MIADLDSDALREAVEHVLACPTCHAAVTHERTHLRCTSCLATYPLVDGIPVLLPPDTGAQAVERRVRDAFAAQYLRADRDAIDTAIGEHHCIPVMRHLAAQFLAQCGSHRWVLDIGTGWGWPWAEQQRHQTIVVAVDMSLPNLAIAQRVLGPGGGVVLVCADATALPIRDGSVGGVWSSQVLQHVPDGMLEQAIREVDRVACASAVMEITNLHPALACRLVYWLAGRPLSHRELRRVTPREWRRIWGDVRRGQSRMSVGFSELCFHPDLRFRPTRYPVRLERLLSTWAPWLAALIARQSTLRIESVGAR